MSSNVLIQLILTSIFRINLSNYEFPTGTRNSKSLYHPYEIVYCNEHSFLQITIIIQNSAIYYAGLVSVWFESISLSLWMKLMIYREKNQLPIPNFLAIRYFYSVMPLELHFRFYWVHTCTVHNIHVSRTKLHKSAVRRTNRV